MQENRWVCSAVLPVVSTVQFRKSQFPKFYSPVVFSAIISIFLWQLPSPVLQSCSSKFHLLYSPAVLNTIYSMVLQFQIPSVLQSYISYLHQFYSLAVLISSVLQPYSSKFHQFYSLPVKQCTRTPVLQFSSFPLPPTSTAPVAQFTSTVAVTCTVTHIPPAPIRGPYKLGSTRNYVRTTSLNRS